MKKEAEAKLPTEFGPFRIVGFRSLNSEEEFVALVKGDINPKTPTLVRIPITHPTPRAQCRTTHCRHRTRDLGNSSNGRLPSTQIRLRPPVQNPTATIRSTARSRPPRNTGTGVATGGGTTLKPESMEEL